MGQCKCLEAQKQLTIEGMPIQDSVDQEQDYQIQRILQPLKLYETLPLPSYYSSVAESYEDFSPEKNIPEDSACTDFVVPNIEITNIPETTFCQNYPKSEKAYQLQGFIYKGQWKKFEPYGFGVFVYNDGAIYIGYSVNFNPHIYGKKLYPDGSEYEGEYLYGSHHGQGILKNKELTFEGIWCSNVPVKGKEIWKDGTIFQGEYKDGRKCGFGFMKWKNGNQYEGMFYNDQFDGYGVYIFADGFIYEGEWRNSQMNGRGKLIYPNSSYFEGEFANDKQINGFQYSLNGLEQTVAQLSFNSTVSERSYLKIDRPSIKAAYIEFKSVCG
ncbi:unnamed protein product (macronuclear) [Paramecium tetraurelia]|uniref:MORN repeat protein n=1 Tax=Paramecium tetraurelia TaxID=5888 RepID=A0CDV0_PARTE|nr:uncharacterized protein GSPATT00007179001 [Paramecium tetraurelia]CAK68967.1 unnamed protein product [Paramecium tetraurelia]|eukprot:XP_001436364.1 hypothetical protein (macronuclear) [Paramecium tetraurelia strain d4-2]